MQLGKIMFIALGSVTVVIGVATYAVLPDTPIQAAFLTSAEQLAILKHVSVNQTGVKNKYFKLSQVLEGFFDVQLWLVAIITILVRFHKA